MRYKWKTRKQNGGAKKIVDVYKFILSSFVYSDAKHDFSSNNNFYEKYKDTIKDTIPNAPYTEYNEETLLGSIKITHINDIPNTEKLTMDKLISEYHTNGITEFDLLIGDKIKRRYDVKVIYYQKNENVITNPEQFIHYFEGLRTFILDCFNLKFFDGFKNTSDTSYYNKNNTFYVLYNREMENDPGNKGRLDTKHYLPIGYRLQDVYDNDKRDITYNKWNNSNLIYQNMFYSNYNLTLTNSFNSYNRTNNVILNINDDKHFNEIYKNLKLSNNINNLIEECNKGKISPQFVFTRKRCGDSLQVLSVFDNNRKLYSSDKDDTDSKIHNNPKMIISLDRLVLYYSLLMGIDIGFTVKRGKGNIDHYLIIFNNRNKEYMLDNSLFNYSKNKIIGGRKSLSIKLKRNRSNLYKVTKTMKSKQMNKKNNIQEVYTQITLPEVEYYLIRDNFKEGYLHYAKYLAKYITSSSNNKKQVVDYIIYKNNIEYTNEYVSKIIFEKYIRIISSYPSRTNEYDTYSSLLSDIRDILVFYNHYDYDDIINKIILHYDTHNKALANNIRSLNCLLWIIESYYDLEEQHTFYNYNKYRLKELMTPKLQKWYDEKTSYEYDYREGQTENDKAQFLDMTIKEYIENDRLGQLIQIIVDIAKNGDKSNPETHEMCEIYEQICNTASWDFIDYSRIISYIIKYDLDVYETLIKLGGDYNNAMYVDKPARPGIQSTAIMVLSQYRYDLDSKRERTPEIQRMIDEIYAIKCNGYVFEYKKAFDDIMVLFRRTFEKYLTWGLEIV